MQLKIASVLRAIAGYTTRKAMIIRWYTRGWFIACSRPRQPLVSKVRGSLSQMPMARTSASKTGTGKLSAEDEVNVVAVEETDDLLSKRIARPAGRAGFHLSWARPFPRSPRERDDARRGQPHLEARARRRDPDGGAVLTANKVATVTICHDDQFTGMINSVVSLMKLKQRTLKYSTGSWSEQVGTSKIHVADPENSYELSYTPKPHRKINNFSTPPKSTKMGESIGPWVSKKRIC